MVDCEEIDGLLKKMTQETVSTLEDVLIDVHGYLPETTSAETVWRVYSALSSFGWEPTAREPDLLGPGYVIGLSVSNDKYSELFYVRGAQVLMGSYAQVHTLRTDKISLQDLKGVSKKIEEKINIKIVIEQGYEHVDIPAAIDLIMRYEKPIEDSVFLNEQDLTAAIADFSEKVKN